MAENFNGYEDNEIMNAQQPWEESVKTPDLETLNKIMNTQPPEIDNVNHPPHYKASNGVETIDVIEGFTDPIAWNSGNVIKYVCRWKNKNGLEDLKKAQFYLNRLIRIVENKEQEGRE